MKENVRLLVDGKESFKQIIKRIREAKKSIYMNVFIWRDDVIGNMIAKELLAAADKGVKITVSKDRLGGIYEKAEENKQSFLHKYLDTRQWIKQKTIDIFYHPHLKAVGGWQKENRLVDQLLKHKNIRILRSKIKKDHSKYYIFDNEIFVTGGINIEDRTIARDIRGSRWNDYMIEIKGKEFVNRLKQRINGDANYDADSQLEFVLNINKRKKFEIKRAILRLLSDAKTVDIQMAYFGDKDIINKIISAANNGTKVR
ncbi:phosphatidylserine/phosphatidylglycerophosphate/cardiolipin synthase family protein, partial [Candidatus Woesearchaeota archaeon]|nr:phosphatidylserine/phosphatidylglycerophosphate/cardiolipin synthase family protein [Candidatus Woesearchaeota archaeon]